MNEEIPFDGMSPEQIKELLDVLLKTAEPKTFKERLAVWAIRFVAFLDKVKCYLRSIPPKLQQIWIRLKEFVKHLLKQESVNGIVTSPSCV